MTEARLSLDLYARTAIARRKKEVSDNTRVSRVLQIPSAVGHNSFFIKINYEPWVDVVNMVTKTVIIVNNIYPERYSSRSRHYMAFFLPLRLVPGIGTSRHL